MFKRPFAALAAAFCLIASAGGASAQTPAASSPPAAAPSEPSVPGDGHATKILAIGTFPPGTDLRLAQRVLPEEVRATARLYLEGKIDQWYSLQDRTGVVFILNLTDPTLARSMLEALPLGQAHLMTFELIPLGPLMPLRVLLASPGGA